MSDGCEFQVRGAATENARRASEELANSRSWDSQQRASDDRRGRTMEQPSGSGRSNIYAGVEEDIVLNVSDASNV